MRNAIVSIFFLIGWLTDLSVAYLMLGAGTIGYLYYTHLHPEVKA